MPGSIDFCWDYSFFKDSNRCLKVKPSTHYKRTHPILCQNAEINCSETWSEEKDGTKPLFCPNSSNQLDCSKKEFFYCNISQTCLPKMKTCDGIVHCLHGEDEADELCFDTISFPEEATVKCVEDRPYYNFTIMSLPCDGLRECKNGEDEDCHLERAHLVLIIFSYFQVTFFIWLFLRLQIGCSVKTPKYEPDEWDKRNCTTLKGDRLANLKVSIKLFDD